MLIFSEHVQAFSFVVVLKNHGVQGSAAFSHPTKGDGNEVLMTSERFDWEHSCHEGEHHSQQWSQGLKPAQSFLHCPEAYLRVGCSGCSGCLYLSLDISLEAEKNAPCQRFNWNAHCQTFVSILWEHLSIRAHKCPSDRPVTILGKEIAFFFQEAAVRFAAVFNTLVGTTSAIRSLTWLHRFASGIHWKNPLLQVYSFKFLLK